MAKVLVFQVEFNGIKGAITDQGSLKAAIKETQRQIARSDFGSKQYQKLDKQLAGLQAQKKLLRDDTRKLQRQMVNSAKAGTDSYRGLTAQLNLLENQYFELSTAERKAAQGQALSKKIRSLRKDIQGIKQDVGRNGLAGAFREAFTTVGGFDVGQIATITGAITLGAEAIRSAGRFVLDSVQVYADFNRQLGILKAVSGASNEELERLKNLSRELGETTQFSASQVAQLEIEYAKLGFEPAEILAATADTLNFATVAQSDLGETASVTASVIRAFNLDASEAGRVSDVAAKSFASSALDLSKFSTAMAAVAPVASSAGVSLEQTTALLGVLADAGLDASTAGTGLRNVFLDIASEGISLEEALDRITTAQDSNVASLELFGKRGAVIGTLLARNQERAASLNETLENSSGFAKDAAEVIQADLRGALDTLSSTLEGARLNLIETFQIGATAAVKGITAIVSGLSSFFILLRQVPEFLRENKTELIALGIAVAGLNANLIASNATLLISAARTKAKIALDRGAAIATAAWRAAQTGLNVALRNNPIGLVVTAVSLLVAGLVQAYKRSEDFRAIVNGLGATAAEFFEIAKEAFGSFIQSFQQIRQGDFSGAISSLGDALKKGNPIGLAVTEGGRLADAFRSGYEDTFKEEPVETEVQEETTEAVKATNEELEQLKQALADAGGETDKTNAQIELLQAKLKGLKRDLEAVPEGTDEYESLQAEIQTTEKRIAALQKTTSGASETTVKFAKGSIADLRNEVQQLRSALDEVAPEDQEPILNKLIDAEANLEQAEAFTEELENRLRFGDRETIAPLQDIDDIRQRITGKEEEAEQILQVESETADRTIEIQREKNERLQQLEEERAQKIQALQDGIFTALNTANDLLSDASQRRAQAEINAVESRYQREIDFAEGNTQRQEELREELDAKKAAIEKKEFERQKRYQIAAAFINLAQGIVNTLAAPTTIPDPFGTAFKVFRVGVLTATTLNQVAEIQSQTASRGALVDDAVSVLGNGNIINNRLVGHPHGNKSKGIPMSVHGIPITAEHGEQIDIDEFGGTAILNKRSSGLFRKQLSAVAGKTFPGKRDYLSMINSYRNWGRPYAAQGAYIRPSTNAITSATNIASVTSRVASVQMDGASAEAMASRTAEAVEKATARGIAIGLMNANRRIERERILNQRTGQ